MQFIGKTEINMTAGKTIKSILFSSHTGAYEGVIRRLQPKPDLAILGIAGRPNLDGLPYQGSAAEFVTREVEWLEHPERIIWVCLIRLSSRIPGQRLIRLLLY